MSFSEFMDCDDGLAFVSFISAGKNQTIIPRFWPDLNPIQTLLTGNTRRYLKARGSVCSYVAALSSGTGFTHLSV